MSTWRHPGRPSSGRHHICKRSIADVSVLDVLSTVWDWDSSLATGGDVWWVADYQHQL